MVHGCSCAIGLSVPSAAARDPASTCTSGRDRTRLPVHRVEPRAQILLRCAAEQRRSHPQLGREVQHRDRSPRPTRTKRRLGQMGSPRDFSEPLAREHIPRGSIVPESSRMFHQFPRLRAHALLFAGRRTRDPSDSSSVLPDSSVAFQWREHLDSVRERRAFRRPDRMLIRSDHPPDRNEGDL